MKQINFTGNIDGTGNMSMFFIIKEATETVLNFPKRIVKIL